MSEIDALKYDLKEKRKAFAKLHKRHLELLKQQGMLEKENEELSWKNDKMSSFIRRNYDPTMIHRILYGGKE